MARFGAPPPMFRRSEGDGGNEVGEGALIARKLVTAMRGMVALATCQRAETSAARRGRDRSGKAEAVARANECSTAQRGEPDRAATLP